MKIEGKIFKKFRERLAIVPSFTIKAMHEEDGVKVIDDAELLNFSLTSQPADRDVTMQPL